MFNLWIDFDDLNATSIAHSCTSSCVISMQLALCGNNYVDQVVDMTGIYLFQVRKKELALQLFYKKNEQVQNNNKKGGV